MDGVELLLFFFGITFNMKRKHDDLDNFVTNTLLPFLLICVVHRHRSRLANLNDESMHQKRITRAVYSRCSFDTFMDRHALASPDLSRTLRMSRQSFDKLVILLPDYLRVDESYAARRGGAISPDYCVFMTVWYLADFCTSLRIFSVQLYTCVFTSC